MDGWKERDGPAIGCLECKEEGYDCIVAESGEVLVPESMDVDTASAWLFSVPGLADSSRFCAG